MTEPLNVQGIIQSNCTSNIVWKEFLMSYLGIGYNGTKTSFLRDEVNLYMDWLKGDRLPRFFGDAFIVLYDSNTAREFAKKCKNNAEPGTILVYHMENPPE